MLVPSLLLLMLATLGGCEAKQKGPDRASPTTSSAASAAPLTKKTGIEACDRLLAAIDTCLKNATESAAESLLESRGLYVRQARGARSEAAKKTVAIGCSAEQDALECE